MYKPKPGEKGYGPRFWPNHLVSEAAMAIWAMGIIVFLAGYSPKGLEDPSNQFVTPAHIKPEWYFLSLYQILRLVPKTFAGIQDFNKPFTLLISGVVTLALLLIPWLDRTGPEAQHPRKRMGLVLIFLAGLAMAVILTFWGMKK
jgi:quinol-cytochrome oxidoreductase complex cytochrome b subunit